MQAKISLFSADIGKRIAYFRERQGVTLSRLADGKPATAKSWEEGKAPRHDRWHGISERLGLSEIFIFHGLPRTPEDYAFVAKYAYEIEEAPEWLQDPSRDKSGDFGLIKKTERTTQKATFNRGMKLNPGFHLPVNVTREQIEEYLRRILDEAESVPGWLGYVHGVLRKHLDIADLKKLKGE